MAIFTRHLGTDIRTQRLLILIDSSSMCSLSDRLEESYIKNLLTVGRCKSIFFNEFYHFISE